MGALNELDATHGFEIGVNPSVVVVDKGVAKSITCTIVDPVPVRSIDVLRSLGPGEKSVLSWALARVGEQWT